MEREKFGSRMGFLLVSAGCAIGIGNVWKFPFIAGENGGAVFVLFYFAALILMGIPIMTMELAVGRASRKSAVLAYKTLEKPGSFWHIHGWFCLAGCYLLMMYYTTVSGWMVSYFFKFLTGAFSNISPDNTADVFTGMLADPLEMTLFMSVTVIAGFTILYFGVKKGLEKTTKIMMLGLLILIVMLVIHSFTLSGAKEGIRFFLYPDWEKARQAGILNVIVQAMNQAFFTLSLGISCIEIFGSYMSTENSITGESIRICILDTIVAVFSGLIIFPACFSFGIRPDQGPSLIFITLPRVFMNMTGGRLWGTLFFVFMTFASLSTVIAVFENIIANMTDYFGIDRKKAIIINAVFILIASLPCVFGYNIWSGVRLIGGRDILDSEDFLVSNILLPLGSLIFLLFCTTKMGWGFDNYLEEVNTGKGIHLSKKLKPFLRFVLPFLILVIFIRGFL